MLFRSYVFSRLQIFDKLSSGTQIIILTVVLASIAAILFPIKEQDGEENEV